jgi:hypothetical protein
VLAEGGSVIDVVYVLGSGSKWEDREFCHSLKSLHKRLKNFRRVVVIGNLPRSVNPDVPVPHFIPFADRDGCKQKNVRQKLLRICDEEAITPEFVLMNDDFFFLRDVEAPTLPYHRMGMLDQHIEHREGRPSSYLESLKITRAWLAERQLPTRDFEVHVPIRYTKETLRRVLTEFDWKAQRGALIRSLFCNMLGVEGSILSDCKINEPLPRDQIVRRVAGRDYFSIGDAALKSADMKTFLNTL